MDRHRTLLQWLEEIPASGDQTTRFARIFAAIRAERLLSNGLLMLVYGTENVSILEDLNSKNVQILLRSLSRAINGKMLNLAQQRRIELFLNEESRVFNQWFSSSGSNPPPPGDGEAPGLD
ncbi:hypothetical protein D9M71_765650 [compost metagenome]